MIRLNVREIAGRKELRDKRRKSNIIDSPP